MNETSRDGFVPRHLRGRKNPIGPPPCQWHRIVDELASYQDRRPCPNPEDAAAGVHLCKDHIRRVGYISGLISRKAARKWIESEDRYEVKRLREELQRMNRRLEWQAKKLRGEPTEEDAVEKRRVTDGTIYALLSGYNVKIGWTGRDLAERLREYPPNSQVLVYFPGKRGDETRIKRKFSHLRTHGKEWFPYAPQVTEWVDQMVKEHGDPDPTITCGPAKYQIPRPHSNQGGIRPRGWVAGTGTISA